MRRPDLPVARPPAPPPPATPAPRRSPSALAVGVIDAAMARTHEQPRLRKPRHRTAEMGAIDGQDEKTILVRVVLALVVNEHAGLGDDAVPGLAQRVVEVHQARLFGLEVG